ncbi:MULTISPECIES: hypothetical protein [unclassified Aeromicrobium]|uniref:hypothetical protein n=1 Tax=unclassified Aeromicrobium TaxID=2633570 RepID=UPI0006FFA57D|nr:MULTISPECIES: hypothetical protein [unclassified Aeromicrobium]KQP78409.1 hypothetical protein ASF37_07540 [Aeromicrobium sp. Leaf289]KQP84119.1 hypothetical protein ASF35_04055 [Aeromicrobium sp. Leaf291]
MRKLLVLLVAALVGVGSTLTLVAPAQAATGVTIRTIADPSAAPGKTATIKPRYSTSGKVKVTYARLTVRQGKKVVARDKASVALKIAADPKVYSVTTVVKYKVKKKGKYGKTITKSKRQDLFAFACATATALKTITYSDAPGAGTTSSAVGKAIGNPQAGDGIALGELYEGGDEATKTEVEGLYGKGWTSTDVLVTLGYARCGTTPTAFAIEYLMAGETEPRAYQLAAE